MLGSRDAANGVWWRGTGARTGLRRAAWVSAGDAGADVRYALRGFRRSPVFTVTVILTLMLGIGATTAVFSVVDRILFPLLPYAHTRTG
jgi:hypothetical protein